MEIGRTRMAKNRADNKYIKPLAGLNGKDLLFKGTSLCQVSSREIYYLRLCSSLGRRSQKMVLGTSIPDSIPKKLLFFGPNRLVKIRVA